MKKRWEQSVLYIIIKICHGVNHGIIDGILKKFIIMLDSAIPGICEDNEDSLFGVNSFDRKVEMTEVIMVLYAID